MIRHGASLLRAFAGASVPKVTLVLRKAFGGAAITMNSKDLGADVVFSWPGAQIGIMAARQAVGIVHGRRLREDETLSRDDLADAYAAEHLTAPAAAASGWVDEVIDARGQPREPRLGAALPEGPLSVASAADGPLRPGRRVVSSYAALGDSFTAGRDSIDAERWADLLAAGMRRVNPELRYENLAVDGATSAEVLDLQVEPGLALEPDFVTVICGANDVLLATRPDVAGYAERIDAIFTPAARGRRRRRCWSPRPRRRAGTSWSCGRAPNGG